MAIRGNSFESTLMLPVIFLVLILRLICWKNQEQFVKRKMREHSISFTNYLLVLQLSNVNATSLTTLRAIHSYRMDQCPYRVLMIMQNIKRQWNPWILWGWTVKTLIPSLRLSVLSYSSARWNSSRREATIKQLFPITQLLKKSLICLGWV